MYKVSRFYKVGLCFAFFSDFIAIYPLYNLIFKDHGMSPLSIATLLIIQKSSKMIFDIPSGLIADFYGRRSILILGAIFNATMLFLFWFKPSFISFAIGMALWGMSMSCFFGHVGAYAYDFLRIKKSEKQFSVFMGLYYVMQNLAIMIACFVGGQLYIIGSLDMAIVLSLFMMLVTVFIGMQLPKYKNRQIESSFLIKKNSFKVTVASIFDCIQNPKIMFFVVLLASSTALFMFFFDLNTVLMNDHNYGAERVSYVVGVVSGIRIISNLISGYATPYISMTCIVFLIPILVLLIIINAAININLTIISISIYLIFFTLIDLVITTKMQSFISSTLRATVMSISNLLASLALILFHLTNGIIANQDSYISATINTLSIVFCFFIILIVWYYKIFKNARNS